MSKRTITLPLHMRNQIIEKARIACSLEGKEPTQDNLNEYVQQFAYEAYTHALQPNPKRGGDPILPNSVFDADTFFTKLINDRISSDKERQSLKWQFKSVITQLVQLYMRINNKDKITKRGFETRTDEAFFEGMSDDEKKDTLTFLYYRRTMAIIFMRIIEIPFRMRVGSIDKILEPAIQWKTIDYSNMYKMKDQYISNLHTVMNKIAGSIQSNVFKPTMAEHIASYFKK